MSRRPGSSREVWTIPAALAGATAFGLVAALLGGEAWRPVAWACLAIPLAVVAACIFRARR